MTDPLAGLDKALADGLNQGMQALRGQAVAESSGPYSQDELNAKDNPYARRHGEPLLNPAVVNAQTGAFRDAWDAVGAKIEADGISAQLRNDNFVADFLQYGTRNMFARPIQQEIESRAEEILDPYIQAALKAWEQQDSTP